MVLTELEQAFAENLILLGAATGPQLLYPILLKESDPRPLWDIVNGLNVAGAQVVSEAKAIAERALAVTGGQAFSFSEGAMVGTWELIAERGSGPGGAVWSAVRGGQEATLRLIPPGTGHDAGRAARFIERSNAGLDPPHPAILKIDEADEDFGWLYTVSVGVECGSLAGLRGPGPLPEPTALALAQSLAGSLAVVHDLGVVHGGLSPLGVLIREQRIYLSDFGVCGGELDGPLEGSRPGGRLGLLLYSSPGLIGGDATRGLDARDDLYALGAVSLHTVLAPGPGDMLAPPGSPWLVEPPVSEGFRAVLRRLLALNPADSYPDARSLLEDLKRVADGGMPGPPPTGVASAARGRRSESAVAQELVRAEMFERLRAPTESASDLRFAPQEEVTPEYEAQDYAPQDAPGGYYEPELEPQTFEDTFTEDMPDFQTPTETGARKGGISSRRLKAPAARSRSDKSGVITRQKGGGWALFAFALVVVLGGGGVGVALSRPVGTALGKSLLGQAEAVAAEPKPDYARAWTLTEQSLEAGSSDPQLVRDLIEFRADLERRAQSERKGLLPEGEDAGDSAKLAPLLGKLELLLLRVRGLATEHLVQFDIYLGEKQGNRHFWGDLADSLLAKGHLDEALVAYMKADSKKGEAFVRRALAEMAFVPGGPYLVLVDGEPTYARRDPCYIGRTEVTRGQYTRFLRALDKLKDKHAHCDTLVEPANKDHAPKGWRPGVDVEADLPATGIDFHDAAAYCGWREVKLADPKTLEAAARGPLCRTFPWGEAAPELAFVNAGGFLGAVAPSGCFPGGAGAGGALDLLGNVEEWTDSKEAGRAPVFGGHHGTAVEELAAGRTGDAAFDERRPTLGFRIMKFVKAQK